ncbi:MAG: excisionase family DNA-binding protein [Agrococcus casei]|uniref:excisionase family DNA-binding protein n=1 Tax=Agrococcus casei TaxID=343512 RepID=UPI003F91C5E2
MELTIESLADIRSSGAATITTAIAARVLQADPRTIRKATEDGTIPAIKIGRKVLIPREKFLAMFDVERQDIAA